MLRWLAIFLVVSSVAAFAAEPIRLTSDQTQVLHLPQDALSVIVNNPAIASVNIDSPRMLLVTPHNPGATSLIVLDNMGQVILQRDIVVSNVQHQYVRVKRMCPASDPSCAAQSYSYCPDGCYDVTVVPPGTGKGGGSAPPPPVAGKGTIDGEPAETLLGPADDCPAGYQKEFVPGITTGDQHYTCVK